MFFFDLAAFRNISPEVFQQDTVYIMVFFFKLMHFQYFSVSLTGNHCGTQMLFYDKFFVWFSITVNSYLHMIFKKVLRKTICKLLLDVENL